MRTVNLLPASLCAAALALPLASAAQASVLVSVDKTTQHMTVSVDGVARYSWPVSTGRPGFDTPNGTFHPFRMDPNHFSDEYENAPMPHAIFFTKTGDAVHGFFDVKHLGLAVSHGCVRLSPANAATLYALVKADGMTDTTVVISGRTPAWRGPIVAQGRAPDETAAAEQPAPAAPGYGQPGYGQPAYAQPGYGQPAYRQPAYGRPYYDQYGRSYYGQPSSAQYGRSYYGQPDADQDQPSYGQPAYRQPQYPRPFGLY